MGNSFGRESGLTSAEIEAWYAARAARLREQAAVRDTAEAAELSANANRNEEEENAEEDHEPSEQADIEADEEPDNTPSNATRSGAISPNMQVPDLFGSNATFLTSVMAKLQRAIRAYKMNDKGTFDAAIKTLRKFRFVDLAKLVSAWVKEHPWETAAIVIPVILLACTPAILVGVGFTSAGIATGSIAAGVQAGIGGSVAAGSTFAIFTSAAMGGYGVPIVFGGVWAAASAVGWGSVLAKYLLGRKKDDDDDDDDIAAAAPMLMIDEDSEEEDDDE